MRRTDDHYYFDIFISSYWFKKQISDRWGSKNKNYKINHTICILTFFIAHTNFWTEALSTSDFFPIYATVLWILFTVGNNLSLNFNIPILCKNSFQNSSDWQLFNCPSFIELLNFSFIFCFPYYYNGHILTHSNYVQINTYVEFLFCQLYF